MDHIFTILTPRLTLAALNLCIKVSCYFSSNEQQTIKLVSQRLHLADDFALPQYTMVVLVEYYFHFKILLEDSVLFEKGL